MAGTGFRQCPRERSGTHPHKRRISSRAETRSASGPAPGRFTARLEGAETEARIGIPAASAFCAISNPPRPLVNRSVPIQWQTPFKKRPSNDLVDRVVPPNVLTDDPSGCRSPSKSAAACRPPVQSKTACSERRASGSPQREFRVNAEVTIGLPQAPTPNRIDGGFSADPATGCGEEIPSQAMGIETGLFKLDLNHIALSIAIHWRVAQPGNLVGRLDDPLGEQKARRQFKVMARGPHGYGQWSAVHPNLKRLLGRERVLQRAKAAVLPFCNLRELDTSCGCAHRGSALLFNSTLTCHQCICQVARSQFRSDTDARCDPLFRC